MSLFVARIKGFVRFKDLMGQLVSRDLKLKYRRSVLGYLWSVLNPLFIMIIMAIVFSKMFTRANITNFPVYLMSGQVMFNFMNLSTKSAIQSINGSASLLKKTYVPKYVFTVSKIISGLIDCVFSMGALLIVMLFTGGEFTWRLFLFPLVLAQNFVFTMGLGLFLAATNVFFRDIQYIYNVRIFIGNRDRIVSKSLIVSMSPGTGKNKHLGFSGNYCIRYDIIPVLDLIFKIFL